jgi:surface protein
MEAAKPEKFRTPFSLYEPNETLATYYFKQKPFSDKTLSIAQEIVRSKEIPTKFTTKEELQLNLQYYATLPKGIRIELSKSKTRMNVSIPLKNEHGEVFKKSLHITPVYLWDVSHITDMSFLFLNDMYAFNENINNWDVSNVTNMQGMFQQAVMFNQPLNSWNVSNVTNMQGMFSTADQFNQPLNSWNVSNVTNMQNMFSNTSDFNQPLNRWNISNVTNMQSMFQDAYNFNQNINNWDISGKNIKDMFLNCHIIEQYKPGFNPDLSSVSSYTLGDPRILKSITIYINLHGNDFPHEKIPTDILNTSVAASPGFLAWGADFHINAQLDMINKIKSIYVGKKISDANKIYAVDYDGITHYTTSKRHVLNYNRNLSHEKSYHPKQVLNEYLKPRPPESYLRSFTYDRGYTYIDDAAAISMGMFIIDDKDDYPNIDINLDNVTHELRNGRDELMTTLENFQNLQKRNLFNVEVAKHFLPEGFVEYDKSSDYKITTSKQYTGIEHYNSIMLSSILFFFKKLGYNHVNILDHTCRGVCEFDPFPMPLRREQSLVEQELYKQRQQYGFGKTRKKRKHKTRRLHVPHTKTRLFRKKTRML